MACGRKVMWCAERNELREKDEVQTEWKAEGVEMKWTLVTGKTDEVECVLLTPEGEA